MTRSIASIIDTLNLYVWYSLLAVSVALLLFGFCRFHLTVEHLQNKWLSVCVGSIVCIVVLQVCIAIADRPEKRIEKMLNRAKGEGITEEVLGCVNRRLNNNGVSRSVSSADVSDVTDGCLDDSLTNKRIHRAEELNKADRERWASELQRIANRD